MFVRDRTKNVLYLTAAMYGREAWQPQRFSINIGQPNVKLLKRYLPIFCLRWRFENSKNSVIFQKKLKFYFKVVLKSGVYTVA